MRTHLAPSALRARGAVALAMLAALSSPLRADAAGTMLDLDFMVLGRALYQSPQDITALAHLPRSDDGSTAVLTYRQNCPAGKTCIALAQYGDDGSNQGRFAPPSSLNFDIVSAAAIDSQNRIVVVGAVAIGAGDYDFQIVRLRPDGAPDAAFSGDGLMAYAFDEGGEGRDVALGVAIDGQDRAVVVGSVERNALNDVDFGLLRLTQGGALDPSFSGNGHMMIEFDLDADGRTDAATAVAIDGENRIVVGGPVKDFDLNISRIGLARLTPSGNLDATWCSGGCNYNPYAVQDGRRVIFFGEDNETRDHTVTALDVTPGGDVVVAGTMRYAGVINAYVLHMGNDGQWLHQNALDGGFGGGTTEIGGVHLVAAGGNGNHDSIVTGATGSAGQRLFFAQRLDATLTPVSGWGDTGIDTSVYSLSATNSLWDTTAIAGQSSVDHRGRVLMAGATREAGDPTPLRAITARLTSTNEIFRDGFEGDMPIGL